MDDRESSSSLVTLYFSLTKTIFLFSIIGISIAGIIISIHKPEFHTASTLFGANGITYRAILEIGFLSIIISAYYVLLFSVHFVRKIPTPLRVILVLFLTNSTISIFWLIFEWAPGLRNAPDLIIYYICCICAGTLIMLKMWLNNRKYNKLLSLYKKRRKQNMLDEADDHA